MSGDLQKYENWRAITESDFVTMFIKTWFAFVATLREIYPKDNLDDIIGKGDTVYLNPFLSEFDTHYILYNNFDKIKENILKVYSLGRKYVLENKKYNRFFSEDFYCLNKTYKFQKETDDYECSVRYAGDYKLTIHVLYKSESYYQEKKPLIIKSEVDFSDLIKRQFKSIEVEKYLDDESAYLNQFVERLKNRVISKYIADFMAGEFNKVFSKKEYTVLNALSSQEINRVLQSSISQMLDDSAGVENLLYYQTPCANFVYKLTNNQVVPIVRTYKWFLKFVYFLRNALFHEIIDPLESFWQVIFKSAYLALKEILDGNISCLQELEKVKKELQFAAWKEMQKKPDIYIPNFNENYYNGDMEIEFIDYSVSADKITLKAHVRLDYWFDSFTVKRVNSLCKAVVTRGKASIEKFKMEKHSTEIVKRI